MGEIWIMIDRFENSKKISFLVEFINFFKFEVNNQPSGSKYSLILMNTSYLEFFYTLL